MNKKNDNYIWNILSSDPSKYRSISITCTCGKVLESIITTEILFFLTEHHLITKHQHGFLPRHSTSTNLLECPNDWTLFFSKKIHLNCLHWLQICFRLHIPFQTLYQTHKYGIKGNLYLWIQAFLNNRSQYVKINSSYSLPCSVSSGVIQGSVIGSLLFNIFINDLSDRFHSNTTVKLFADDIKLYTSYTNFNCMTLS